jgi:solute carrier family 34 (sodium-dependent phosphate cotransporter)
LETLTSHETKPKLWENLKLIAYILGTLLLFFFALNLLLSSFQFVGKEVVETIIKTTSNPFTGLFIGLLITAMIQSSSTTTALTVALVASGSLSIHSAVPIIMGANIGTTITSTIVSLAFINKKKEFRRAVAAGSYHCFFNLLTVLILFPLEYKYGFLTNVSENAATYFSDGHVESAESSAHGWSWLDPITDFIVKLVPNGFILILLAFILVFVSVLLFRKVISDLLKARSPEVFSRFFFKNQVKSFGWGLLTTAAIRSSTVTTSVVVPIVAKKITDLHKAAPFIMGANVGTTITAFIASLMNANSTNALSIAIAHFLFNAIGVLLFFPVPLLRNIPIMLAEELGKVTMRYRLAGFIFLLITFFIIPFSLIYFNQ